MVPSGLKKTIAKLKLTSWLPIIGFLVVGVYWLIQTWSVGQVSDASAASSTASKVNSALLILILLTILTSNLERDVKNREFTEELENKLADFRRILSGHQERPSR
jgi:H+/gluconate symporter-like permease